MFHHLFCWISNLRWNFNISLFRHFATLGLYLWYDWQLSGCICSEVERIGYEGKILYSWVLFNPERCKLRITYYAYYAHHYPSNLSRFPKQDTISIAIILSTPAKTCPVIYLPIHTNQHHLHWPWAIQSNHWRSRPAHSSIYLSTPANTIYTDQG